VTVVVKIPAQLRNLTGNEAETEVEGSSVGEALDALY
jgi:molybdopterin converting factor small subunit